MDIYEITRQNLITILDESFKGKVKYLAEAMDKQPSQISRHIKVRGGEPKTIGSSMARQFETAAGKPEDWLDRFHGGVQEDNVIPYKTENIEDLAEEKALYFADEFERQLEIKLSAKDKRELFKRMRDRYLRQISEGQKVPGNEKEMEAEVLDFIEITRQMQQ